MAESVSESLPCFVVLPNSSATMLMISVLFNLKK